jgi:hypothetical protein
MHAVSLAITTTTMRWLDEQCAVADFCAVEAAGDSRKNPGGYGPVTTFCNTSTPVLRDQGTSAPGSSEQRGCAISGGSD